MKKKTRKRKRRKGLGSVPGTLTYTGSKPEQEFGIEVIDYSRESCDHTFYNNVQEVFGYADAGNVSWINVNGLHHVEAIEALGKHYRWHPLVLEDVVDTYQRPKIDEFDDYIFVVFKMLYYEENHPVTEHLSLIIGKDYVVTFQESRTDVFDDLRKRILENRGLVRGEKADYLLFILLDAVVDHYFLVIETLGDKIEDLEDALFEDYTDDISREILKLKKEILRVKRSIFPTREIVSRLEKSDSEMIRPHIKNYYRDLYDHAIQVVEYIEGYREMILSLMEMYMGTISNKMNNVMKVLTVIATIFIPLTFIAGIYGMNFDYMPELHGKYSYFILLGVMLLIFIGMLLYFRRKKWL
ncbi:magnesium/cobalt transporter CorA [Sinomicrobium kalidii]|uniref:magnesium/cobalt transporter CorA n=1 Tax=Sinomicrobium kalidii TaxID=2900738 RepID=UPI001E358FDE|nr:magnesium/cobalt transporter CorA [Sinomicrobium kalidii]UGU15992.1 magnesium/cobalt transporter CorA [Sinomicrobium kalidii]